MQKSFSTKDRRSLLFSLLFLGLVAALIFVPAQFISQAGGNSNAKKGLLQRTTSQDEGIVKMYDIREDKTQLDNLADFRSRVGRSAVDVADQRERFVRGEEYLRSQLPTAKVDYNLDIRIPELITPDVYAARVQWLTQPSSAKRTDILRNFVKEHNLLVGLDNQQVDGLRVAADYTNPDGNLSYVHLEQRINGVPVFRGEVKAGFTKNNEVIRVINNLAPGLDYDSLSTDFRNPLNAVQKAATHINHELRTEDTSRNDAESNDLKVVFGGGDWATTAEKMYFPTEPGVAVPAWRILIWRPINAYYVIVDAESGIVLWHKNITDDQTQSGTYNVYANAPSYINTADDPAPLTPYISIPPNDPTVGAQGVNPARTNQTLIGNEGPLMTINQQGWMIDGANVTDGNAVEAGIDRVAPNGVDAPQAGDTACPGAGCRIFTSTWNPPPGVPAPGDDPLTPQAQRGAVIQMWWLMNKYHDELYLRGFTEAALNFQGTNFSGMGIGNDRVSAEGQDSSGTNNANFATPADGGRGRMQMFLWTGPTPDKDGTPDGGIVIHEVTHGTSNRLHGNGSGLGNQGGMMGEGWGDWYASTMLAEPTDPALGVYSLGGYATHLLGPTFTSNYYHAIRRFPTAVIASTGGPNNRPHNPLTFGHLNVGCDTTLGTTTTAVSSAFPRNPVIATAGNCSQVHNAGEIWKSALWEVRALLIANRGFTNGTRAVLQVVTDGMKLTPVNPNMLQERDGIIAAATALPAAADNLTGADALAVREGFRRRGFGFSASVQSATAVTEAFDAPTVGTGAASVTSGNNLLEPNECNTLNVLLNNNSGDNATGISAVLSTTTPGITVTQANSAYPNIAGGAQGVANTTPYQVSIDPTVMCFTQASFTLTTTYTGGGGGSPLVTNFSLPVGIPGNAYTFTAGTGTIPAGGVFVTGSDADDAAVTIALPAGWNSSIYGVAVTSLSASTNGLITANAATSTVFTNTAFPLAAGGTSPTLAPLWDDMIMTAANVTGGGIFRNETGTAPNRQLVIEWRAQHFAETVNGPITINFAVVLTEGTPNIRYIYTLTGIAPNANGVSATVGVQRQATGTEFTQVSFNTATVMPGTTQTGTLPAGMCTPGTGPCNVAPDNPRADFDGDGKTDLSVFRPGEGNWYLNRSTAGFGVINWGMASDTTIPADYDGDGKADTAVYRPSADPALNDYFVLNSNGFTFTGTAWGVPGDIPIQGDYDGDGKDDRTVFRPSNGTWYTLNSSNGSNAIAPFGLATDIPLSIDNDGNGRNNLAVYRPSENTWYIAKPTGTPATNFDAFPFGLAGDRQVQADYNADGRDDIAVFRPSNGTWYIRNSATGVTSIVPFGAMGDVPVPGDYDGDGSDDVAVYRAGTWFVNRSTAGLLTQNFGLGSDIPIPVRYLPAAAVAPVSNYTFAAGTATIPAGGVFVTGSDADDAAITIPLPAGWNSTIYNVPVTSLSASTNGLITANAATATTFGNTALPAVAGTTNPSLAPLWDDMIMTAANVTGGGIFRNEIGTAPNRQLVIEWRAQHFAETVNGPISLNFAVVLTEGTNTVRYIYTSTGIAPNANGLSATVGIQRQATGMQFTQHSFNTAVITPGLQLTGTN